MSNGTFMCLLRVSFIVRFFTSVNLPPSHHSSSNSAGEQALHPHNLHFTPRRHNPRVQGYGRGRSPLASGPTPPQPDGVSLEQSGERSPQGQPPPQPDGMFASSKEGRTPISQRPPTNPEASYLRADPSTRPGGGIRRIASCIRG